MESNNKLKGLRKLILGLGIVTLLSPIKASAEPKASEIMMIEFLPNYQLAIEYDTDNDGAGDTKYLYYARPGGNFIWLKPYAFIEDKDRNGTYENDELIYIKEIEKKFMTRK